MRFPNRTGMRIAAEVKPYQSLGYLAPVEYIERELAKIRSPVLPMWSASTVFVLPSAP